MITAGAFIVGLVCGFVGYAWISAPERRRQSKRLAISRARCKVAEERRDHYRSLYANKVAEVTVYLARFGGNNPIALNVDVAQEARGIDQEWANLNAQVDVERFWGEES